MFFVFGSSPSSISVQLFPMLCLSHVFVYFCFPSYSRVAQLLHDKYSIWSALQIVEQNETKQPVSM